MARPQRKNVDYFPHYISDGKKMFYIEQKYGNDGYASWFKILETLAKTDDHWINLNEVTELMFLASKCRISEDQLLKLLTDLAKLDQINSEMWDVRVVWSDKFIDSIEDAYSKRSNKCQSLEGLRIHLLCLGILKGDVKPQSKVKESKVNEIKEKETKKNIEERKTEFYNSLLPFVDEFGKVMIREFFDYWSEHGERDRKFRMEKEKVFDIYKRLTRWKLKSNTFVNKETPQVYTKPKLYN